MKKISLRWRALVLACLALAACQDRREPVKPTVASNASVAAPARA